MARRARGQLIPKGRERWLIRIYTGQVWNPKPKPTKHTPNPQPGWERQYVSKLFEGSRTDAKEELDQMLAARAKGQIVVAPRTLTVGAWLDSWLDTVVRPARRARTHTDYTAVVNRYIKPHLGNLRLRKLTAAAVRSWLVKLREKGLAPRTVRMAHEVLRNALTAAVTDGLLTDNPAKSERVSRALPPKAKPDRVTIVAADVRAFLDATSGDRLGAYWTLMLLTGLRPSEALALTWRSVNGDVASITRVLVDKPGIPFPTWEAPKSKTSRRAVVLPTAVTAALRDHRKRQIEERLAAGPEWVDQDLIFCTPAGGALKQDQTRDSFRAILIGAGLPTMRPYDLRHSAASLLLSSGESLSVVSELLGHSSIAITKDTYGHIDAGAIRGAASTFDRLARGG